MAQKNTESKEYKAFVKALSEGVPESCYIFHGEEHYLMDRYLEKLRDLILNGGMEEFNHRRFDGRGLTFGEMSDAVDMLPVFAERTLVEIRDYDIFKLPESDRKRLISMLSELPEYVCLVFIYDTVEFKPDKRLKDVKEILKYAHEVEFSLQDSEKIVRWICRHVKEGGKTVSPQNAEYLSFITGGQMTVLNTEIGKLCSYTEGGEITKKEIDACVIPVPDAVTYKMTDAITKGDRSEAAGILSELFRMREPAQKIIFSVSASMRQLLFAKIAQTSGKSAGYLMENFGVRYDFQAKNLMASAKRTDISKCRAAVLLCSETAFAINSGADPEEALSELIASICFNKDVREHA